MRQDVRKEGIAAVARSSLWIELEQKASFFGDAFDLRDAFERLPERASAFALGAAGIHADLSRNLWDESLRADLVSLAQRRNVEGLREAMWSGAPINCTEGRAV